MRRRDRGKGERGREGTESGVETLVNTPTIPVNEPIMRIEKPSKAVSKIMVFYSDHTFETFIPEKSKKE